MGDLGLIRTGADSIIAGVDRAMGDRQLVPLSRPVTSRRARSNSCHQLRKGHHRVGMPSGGVLAPCGSCDSRFREGHPGRCASALLCCRKIRDATQAIRILPTCCPLPGSCMYVGTVNFKARQGKQGRYSTVGTVGTCESNGIRQAKSGEGEQSNVAQTGTNRPPYPARISGYISRVL